MFCNFTEAFHDHFHCLHTEHLCIQSSFRRHIRFNRMDKCIDRTRCKKWIWKSCQQFRNQYRTVCINLVDSKPHLGMQLCKFCDWYIRDLWPRTTRSWYCDQRFCSLKRNLSSKDFFRTILSCEHQDLSHIDNCASSDRNNSVTVCLTEICQ